MQFTSKAEPTVLVSTISNISYYLLVCSSTKFCISNFSHDNAIFGNTTI